MTAHKEKVSEVLDWLHREYMGELRAWEIDTGQAYAKYSAIEAIHRAVHSMIAGRRPEQAAAEGRRKLRTIAYGLKGHPDITGLINGHWFGIEVKIKKDKQSADQKKFQQFVERMGGTYILVRFDSKQTPLEEQLKCLKQYTKKS